DMRPRRHRQHRRCPGSRKRLSAVPGLTHGSAGSLRPPGPQSRPGDVSLRNSQRYHSDNMLQMQPVRIAGAGPSGLAAAIALAKGGRAVEVHEAKPDVGTRFIGDLQIIESASEREPVPVFLDRIGIARNFYFRPADWATFYDHRRVARVIRSGEPYGWFIRRGADEGTLDRGLLDQARAAGAEVIFGSRIVDADIVATGPASPDGLAREMTWHTDEPERIDV